MNKIYRLVWSKSRKTLIAVAENTTGQGKSGSKSATVGTVLASTLMALGGLVSTEANAVCTNVIATIGMTTGNCYVVQTGTTFTGRVFANGGQSITSFSNSGRLNNASAVATVRLAGDITGGITNSGQISLSAASASIATVQITNGTLSGGLHNSGTMSASGAGAGGLLINHGVLNGGITNSGSIGASIGGGILLKTASTLNGGITNSGTVNGANEAIKVALAQLNNGINNTGFLSGGTRGIRLVSAAILSGGITNSGAIFSSGGVGIEVAAGSTLGGGIRDVGGGFISGPAGGILNAGMINGVAKGVFFSLGSLSGGIRNTGTISGSTSGINAKKSTLTGGITNSGSISGSLQEAIRISGTSLSGGINNSGSIRGQNAGIGINNIFSGPTTVAMLSGGITNSGTITGVGSAGVMIRLATASGGIINSGSIGGAGAGVQLSRTSLSGGITNSGTITNTGGTAGAVSLYGSTVSGGITNSGSISGAPNGVWLSHAYLSGGINNTGTITGNTGIQIVGVSTLTGGINNSSLITSTGGKGINLDQTFLSGGITNSGTISSAGSAGTINLNATTLTGGIANSGLIVNAANNTFMVQGSSLSGGINNSGTMSAANVGIGFSNSTLTGGITNSGMMAGAGLAGTINVASSSITGGIINTGTITNSGGAAIRLFSGSIDTITNLGTIKGGGVTQYGIQNAGTITTLNNAQGAGNSNGALKYTGNLPLNYNISIASSTNYGQLSATTVTGAMAFGVYSNSTVAAQTYTAVLSGIASSNLASGTSGTFGSYNYLLSLENGSSTIWDLAFTAVAPSSTSITGAGTVYQSSNLGTTVNPVFDGGTLQISSAGVITQNFTVNNNNGVIDQNGLTSTFSGSIVNAGPPAGVGGGSSNGSNAPINGSITIANSGVGGAVVFTGINTYTGSTTINSGATLALAGAGSIATSSGIVNNGGFNVAVKSGNIALGGTYRQGSTGTLYMGFAPTANQQVNAAGAVTLAGTLNLNASSGTYAAGRYTILTGSTVSGTFGTLTSNLASVTSLGYSLSYDANDVYLNLQAANTNYVTNTSINNNPAAGGAALVLTSLSSNPTPGMAPVITALNNLSGQAQSNAISQTLPVVVGASSLATANSQRGLGQIVQARQSAVAGLSAGEDFIAARDVWMKGFGSWANQNDVNNVSGYKINTGGVAIGGDYALSPKTNVGGVFAFANSNVNGNSSAAPSSVAVTSYQLGEYGDTALSDDLNWNYQADVGMNKNTGSRGITFMGATANSNYNSYSAHFGTGLTKLYPLTPDTRFIPSVRADYLTVKSQAYTETNAGALNLNVNSQTYEEFLLSANFRLDHDLTDRLKLTGNVGAGYNLMNNQVQITSSYAGGGAAFATNGLQISPWLYNAGLGVIGQIQKGYELIVRYDVQATTSGYLNQMGSAKLKILF